MGAHYVKYIYLTLVLFTSHVDAYNYDDWIQGSTNLLRPSTTMAIAYSNKNDTIWLLGGYDQNGFRQLVAFNNDTFTDYGTDFFNEDIHGYSQYYTQMGVFLYMIRGTGTEIQRFNVESLELYTLNTTIPIDVEDDGCLASMIDNGGMEYLFIIGGRVGSNSLSNTQIFNISNNEWIQFVPSMQRRRAYLSCIISNHILYAIGGFDVGNGYLDTIETLNVTNVMEIRNKSWKYVTETLHVPYGYNRAMKYENDILIIGGWTGNELVTEMNVINTYEMNNSVRTACYMDIGLYSTSIIIANGIGYSFGGYNFTNFLSGYRTINLRTNEPTVTPSSTPSSTPSMAPTIILTSMAPPMTTSIYIYEIRVEFYANSEWNSTRILVAIETAYPQSDVILVEIDEESVIVQLSITSNTDLSSNDIQQTLENELEDEQDIKNISVEQVDDIDQKQSFLESIPFLWIILIVVGVIVILMLLILLFIYLKRKQKSQANIDSIETNEMTGIQSENDLENENDTQFTVTTKGNDDIINDNDNENEDMYLTVMNTTQNVINDENEDILDENEDNDDMYEPIQTPSIPNGDATNDIIDNENEDIYQNNDNITISTLNGESKGN